MRQAATRRPRHQTGSSMTTAGPACPCRAAASSGRIDAPGGSTPSGSTSSSRSVAGWFPEPGTSTGIVSNASWRPSAGCQDSASTRNCGRMPGGTTSQEPLVGTRGLPGAPPLVKPSMDRAQRGWPSGPR
ncbi:MAG: hypothetical protein IPO18_16200 [bacterium]|nr:hypothetical protein [bacterium]MBK9473786.1 hypothetical protein [bacterium]